MTSRKTTTLVAAALALALALPHAATANEVEVTLHPDTAFDGAAATFATVVERDDGGRPVRVGVRIPDFDTGALSLPAADPPVGARLPIGADDFAADHVGFDYNPTGHPGGFTDERFAEIVALGPGSPEWAAAYVGESPWLGVPHFDIHFYLDAPDVVESWLCDTPAPPCAPSPANAEFFNFPADGFIPDEFYADPFAAVPQMGVHWIPRDLPETKENGLFLVQPVEVWGSWGGSTAFFETMVSLDAMRAAKAAGTALSGAWKRPRHSPKAGYWPTTWSIAYDADAGTYLFELGDLEYRCEGYCALSGCACDSAAFSSPGTSATLSFRDGEPCFK